MDKYATEGANPTTAAAQECLGETALEFWEEAERCCKRDDKEGWLDNWERESEARFRLALLGEMARHNNTMQSIEEHLARLTSGGDL